MGRVIRKGKCKRCGQCCNLKNLLNAGSNKWIKLSVDVEKLGGVWCKHFERDSGGKGSCKLFGKPERPLACILFPTSEKELLEGCGYYFEKEESL